MVWVLRVSWLAAIFAVSHQNPGVCDFVMNERCIKFFNVSVQERYARKICDTAGKRIASFSSKDMKKLVSKAELFPGGAWQGLKGNLIKWSWISDDRYVPSNVSVPSRFKQLLLCGNIEGKCLQSHTCRNARRYICELALDEEKCNTISGGFFIKTGGTQDKKRSPYLDHGFNCRLNQPPLVSRSVRDKCLFVSKGLQSWFAARNDCLDKGGDLAKIDDQKYIDVMQQENILDKGPFWIGLTNSQWKWSDGTNLKQSSWASDEPVTYGLKNYDTICTKVIKVGNDALWKAVPCEQFLPFFCEMERGQNASTPKEKDFTSGFGVGLACAAAIAILVAVATVLVRRFRRGNEPKSISVANGERPNKPPLYPNNTYTDGPTHETTRPPLPLPRPRQGSHTYTELEGTVRPSDEVYECSCHPRKDSGPYIEILPYDNPAFVSMDQTTKVQPRPLPHIVKRTQLSPTGKVITESTDIPTCEHPKGDESKKIRKRQLSEQHEYLEVTPERGT